MSILQTKKKKKKSREVKPSAQDHTVSKKGIQL